MVKTRLYNTPPHTSFCETQWRHSVKTRLYNNPPPYFIVLASSVKTKEVEVIEFYRSVHDYTTPPILRIASESSNTGIDAIMVSQAQPSQVGSFSRPNRRDFTLTVVNDFRRFLGEFSTNFNKNYTSTDFSWYGDY